MFIIHVHLQAFTLCPQLKSCRHTLSARLSHTYINQPKTVFKTIGEIPPKDATKVASSSSGGDMETESVVQENLHDAYPSPG